jgi:ABC-type Fe3+ transport system substrate-binding protein
MRLWTDSRHTRRGFLRTVGLGACLSMAAACSTPAATPAPTGAPAPAAPPATAPAAVAKPTTAPAVVSPSVNMQAIEDAARKEGALTVYAGLNADDFPKLISGFTKRYPEIKVDEVRGAGPDLNARIITEIKGGKVLGDVLEQNAFDWGAISSAGYLEPFLPPESEAIPAAFKEATGLWIAPRQTILTIAYNMTLVPAGTEPKTFDDVIDPKWKDNILVEITDVQSWIGLVYGKWDGDATKATDWLKKVAANNPQMNRSHSSTADLLAAGQRGIFFWAYAAHVEARKAKGAPIEWGKTEGGLLTEPMSLFKNAPHPNAARLFMNWIISDEGAQGWVSLGETPTRPGVKATVNIPDGMKGYPVRPEMAAEADKFQQIWNTTLGLT